MRKYCASCGVLFLNAKYYKRCPILCNICNDNYCYNCITLKCEICHVFLACDICTDELQLEIHRCDKHLNTDKDIDNKICVNMKCKCHHTNT